MTDLATDQWERLCDGCGWCCLHKLEDSDTGLVYYTRVACELLDIARCRCRDYPRRRQQVPECRRLTPSRVARMHWLPTTCAYRRRWHERPLPWWHHLNTGDPDLVHRLGLSARDVAVVRPGIDTEQLKSERLDALPWEMNIRNGNALSY